MNESQLYATPQEVTRLDDCLFYHSCEIPGYGEVEGEWDLRGDTAGYLGRVELSGKRVLEIGPASGYLSFWMERQGAEVVSVDVADDFVFDVVPFADIDRKALSDGFVGAQKSVQNGYWLTHRAMESRNRVHYGSAYQIPQGLGSFDVGVMASMLLHNANPVAIIDQVAKRVTGQLIIVDLYHEGASKEAPTIEFHPSVENKVWHTWWRFSPGFFAEVVKIMGFRVVRHVTTTQLYKGQPFPLHATVAERI